MNSVFYMPFYQDAGADVHIGPKFASKIIMKFLNLFKNNVICISLKNGSLSELEFGSRYREKVPMKDQNMKL